MATITILGLTPLRPRRSMAWPLTGARRDGRDTPHGSADWCRGHRRRREDARRCWLCADLPSLARPQHPGGARPGTRDWGFSALQPTFWTGCAPPLEIDAPP